LKENPGKFELFRKDVDEGWNNFEITVFHV